MPFQQELQIVLNTELNCIYWKTWFIEPVLRARPWDYPVSKANSLWISRPCGQPLWWGAHTEVNTSLLTLGAFSCCCLPSITLDTRERSQENWTISSIKTILSGHSEMNTFHGGQWEDGTPCMIDRGWPGERKEISLKRTGEPNIQLYLLFFTFLSRKMFIAWAASGIYINKLISHEPAVNYFPWTSSSF